MSITLDPNPHFSAPLWVRLVRRLLWLAPLYRSWRLDHSPSMSWLGKCRCRDCASVKYEPPYFRPESMSDKEMAELIKRLIDERMDTNGSQNA